MIHSHVPGSLIGRIWKSLSYHKYELKFVAPVAIALLCYSAVRAALLSFTHDESASYHIINFIGTYWDMPNNHPLNTLLMAI
jgi:hypothetical protein